MPNANAILAFKTHAKSLRLIWFLLANNITVADMAWSLIPNHPDMLGKLGMLNLLRREDV